MSAITQASAQVAKTVAVSTGKVTNAKSMMVWKPHGNKYVFDARRVRRASEGWLTTTIAIATFDRSFDRSFARVDGADRARATRRRLGDAARATDDS